MDKGAKIIGDMERELRELRLLLDISQLLQRDLDLEEILRHVLKKMAEIMGMLRGTITLLNRDTNTIEIDLAYGLSVEERARGKYRLGEGITGQVVATGLPAVVRRVSEEPLFLDRTGTRLREMNRCRQDISFICVPIHARDGVIGALSADRLFSEEVSLAEDVRVLTIISTMIARSVEMRRVALERERALIEEKERLQGELLDRLRHSRIIGESHAIRQVCRLIRQVAPSRATVLIRGESGVGKELVAEAIHMNSPRVDRPFVSVNLAALPETLIESELFGHERGAFTGALASRAGRFEAAEGGTLFLDEIGDVSPAVQVRLLRVLQEKTYERVGGNETRAADVRLVVATNRDLEKLVAEEKFRLDLYYRLNVFPIFVPPLRARKTDIPLLADYFLERAARRHGRKKSSISSAALDLMMNYDWPGNVRELENCIERAVLLTDDEIIHAHHLPPTLQGAEAAGVAARGPLAAALRSLEREMIIEALKASRGNLAAAARSLGITERKMGLRVRAHGIIPGRFKPDPAPSDALAARS